MICANGVGDLRVVELGSYSVPYSHAIKNFNKGAVHYSLTTKKIDLKGTHKKIDRGG